MENDTTFSDTEKIELLKMSLQNLITHFELPINIVYFIYKDCFNDLTSLYQQYQNKIYEDIKNKQEKIDKQNYTKELKKECPEVTLEEYQTEVI